MRGWFRSVAVMALATTCAGAVAHPRAIDVSKSTLTVRVYKAGVLSAFGHDHVITAPVGGGWADTTAHRVELHADAGKLRVSDPKASEKDRAEIQKTMLGPEVLDSARA